MPEQDEFAPVKAVKSQSKLKLAISGPSSSGKTDGALSLATLFGSCADRLQKPRILVVDTENRSSQLYADRYDFEIIGLKAPYTPERYRKAMQRAIDGGFDWLIVDSISHEWEGEGGIRWKKDRLDLAPNSNGWANWAKLTPDHDAFVEFIKQCPIHTICTMRSKQEYKLVENAKGKQVPVKLGMEPIQRPGVEYEFTLIFDLDMKHNAKASKNRTTLFDDEDEFINLRDPQVAQSLRNWLESGVEEEASPEWKPQLGTVRVNATGEVVVEQAPAARPPVPAVRPGLINAPQKQQFWITLRQAGKTDEQVRIWLFDRFKIATSAEIPAEKFEEAMEWARKTAPPANMTPEEVKAREAAKVLGVAEVDLQYELGEAQGDWSTVYDRLNSRADAETLAMEQMKSQPQPEPVPQPAGRQRRRAG